MPDNADLAGADAARLRAELELARRRNAELERTVGDLNRSVLELEAFSREISHDLKGPLAGICGYAQLLTHLDLGAYRPAEFDEFVEEINRGTDRMRRLIDDVLTYSTARGAPLEPATVDLTALVHTVIADRVREMSAPGVGAHPATHITWDQMPAVRGDLGMLRRVLDNLLGNALKYVRPGQAARVHLSARADKPGLVRVEVTDDGVGIPDGQHELIFTELHRAHADAYPGTGLGLSICRRIVHRLGGTIGADPEFRDGARIWFTVPAADAGTERATADAGAGSMAA
ncbi:sensor histidine kinase [Jidongwangia harbinensis]|uniref:sensor histidine kinase n=1 Tax=Jidongwangia harbinensis TaxID=2878561 RepID=UPI001CDA38D3|nr:HAMP domain-containing sensor histidine kinase [Jidongwangia harbinensis]MCA2213949.1 HAMP domain-containing histidine kinase [Jidongwangia harbinensis]